VSVVSGEKRHHVRREKNTAFPGNNSKPIKTKKKKTLDYNAGHKSRGAGGRVRGKIRINSLTHLHKETVKSQYKTEKN